MEYGKGVLGDSFYKSDWLTDRFKIMSLFTQSNIFFTENDSLFFTKIMITWLRTQSLTPYLSELTIWVFLNQVYFKLGKHKQVVMNLVS